jgi:hypothetical protein
MKLINGTCSKIITGALLLAHLCVPLPAHAGLLDALFSPTYNEFRKLVDAGNNEAASSLLAREADYFGKLEGDKRANVEAFRQTYFLDQLTAFVAAERDTEALALVGAQIERFRTLPDEAGIRYQALLNTLDLRQAARLQQLMTELDKADNNPAPMKRWSLLKAALASAPIKGKEAGYPVKLEKAESIRTLLDTRCQTIISKLNAEASEAMASYGWFSQPSFTEVYPVKPDSAALMGDGTLLLAQLESASTAKIKRFAQMYLSAMPAELKRKVAASYMSKLASERGAKSYLDKRALADEAKRDGFDADNSSVLFATWPLPEALRQFMMTPRPPKAVGLTELSAYQTPSDFLATPEAKLHDLVVFLRFHEPKTERNEKSRQTLSSRYPSGMRTVNNPRYAEAVEAVARAERSLAYAQAQVQASSGKGESSNLGIVIALLGAVTDSAARSSLDKARQNLADTPRALQERVFTNYTYTRALQHIRKSYGVKFAIHDPGTGETYVDEVRPGRDRDFTVVEGVNASDPDAATILRGATDAQAIETYTNKPVNADYDEIWQLILDKYRKAKTGEQS